MIQLISYHGVKEDSEHQISTSKINSPNSLDEFKINIIDLNDEGIWRNSQATYKSIDTIRDLKHMGEMIKNRSNSTVILKLPQNLIMRYNKFGSREGDYHNQRELKNMLPEMGNIIQKFLEWFDCKILFENTTTIIGDNHIKASFYFENNHNAVTSSSKSNKTTTIKISETTIITTLDLNSHEEINCFLTELKLIVNPSIQPTWINGIIFFDDIKQRGIIQEKERQIEEMKIEIDQANRRLVENSKYKSVLFENGSELVKVVFEMLGIMFSCDLSGFIDNNNEDLLFKVNEVTFIVEIKGVTSNVKSVHISQLDVHYQSFLEKLQEKDTEETVKALLIINHQRNIELKDRNPIHMNQINLAKRNGCLIIGTATLLRVFDDYKQQKITMEQIADLFINNSGELLYK